MRSYLKVFAILFLVSLLILLVLKWTRIKNLLVNLRGGSRESTSLIRALPFDVLQEKPRRDLYDLQKKLTPTQILIQDIAASPKGAPAGKYVRVSVVVEAWNRKAALELQAHRGRLASLILDSIQRFPYQKLGTRSGLLDFKKNITRRIEFFYGDRVKNVSIVQFEIREAKR